MISKLLHPLIQSVDVYLKKQTNKNPQTVAFEINAINDFLNRSYVCVCVYTVFWEEKQLLAQRPKSQ